jgi:tripartite ATP-independent transporter DctM subunit
MGGNPILANLTLFGAFFLLLATGLPMVFCLFVLAFLGLTLFAGLGGAVNIIHLAVLDTSGFSVLITVPLFIFMASLLEKTAIAEDVYESLHQWLEGLPGGLAISTVIVGLINGLLLNESGVAVISLGKIALPAMLKHGYNRNFAAGTVLAAAGLAVIIPPSVLLVVYSTTVEVELGALFLGGVVPGLLLGLLFTLYISITCSLKRQTGPATPPAERISRRERLISLQLLSFPVFLITSILAGIFYGVLVPSEAAVAGSAMTLCWAVTTRRLTWRGFKGACYQTLRLTCMIMWVVVGSRCFRSLYIFTGAGQIGSLVAAQGTAKWGIIVFLQVMLLFFGLFLDPLVITLLFMPIIAPILQTQGFDLLWFGELFAVNMMISLVTPPVGIDVLYLKGIEPTGLSVKALYAGAAPFVFLQLVALVLIMLFPWLALWLPGLMTRIH